uniref:CaMBD domain-containing protein n=1 Tax=Macrostomum lignano TaxID=282301 RepID=A0A1I8FZL8_9PLAT
MLADLSLLFALLGVALMVAEAELCMAGTLRKDQAGSAILKSFISLSTAILLGFIVLYHWLDLQVFMIDNSMENYRLVLDAGRVFRLALELAVCAVHPPPTNRTDEAQLLQQTHQPREGQLDQHLVPFDVILGLPMFLRFYLICRVLMLHSRLFQDASSQSLGALNRVPFNFRFIFKSMMSMYPEYVLTAAALVLFIWASWATRACEMYRGKKHRNFLNSMWLTAITFLTVGYGDVVPETYCSRGVAVLTGIFGTGVTALVVAVLARRLELSRAEKYVHNFVIDTELDKRMRHSAANILKEGWLAYKFRRSGDAAASLRHQRKLLHSIYQIRQLRSDQRRLADNSIGLLEVHKNQGFILTGVQQLHSRIREAEARMVNIDDKLDRLLSRAEYYSLTRLRVIMTPTQAVNEELQTVQIVCVFFLLVLSLMWGGFAIAPFVRMLTAEPTEVKVCKNAADADVTNGLCRRNPARAAALALPRVDWRSRSCTGCYYRVSDRQRQFRQLLRHCLVQRRKRNQSTCLSRTQLPMPLTA